MGQTPIVERFDLVPQFRTGCRLRFCSLAVAVSLGLCGWAGAQESRSEAHRRTNLSAARPSASATKEPWGRMVLVGASVSAGFTESEPFGGPLTRNYRLSRYLDAAVRAPHEPVQSLANVLFFLYPEQEGRKQMEAVLKAKPTLVAGIDFLFWFCYGAGPTDADRAKRFEQGLKLLEAVSCPLLLGDIPDASSALNTALDPEQIPSPTAIASANRRLRQWAAGRDQVTIVPLSSIMRSVTANQAVTVHAHTVAAGKSRQLLQADRLHPSPPGCVILALSALDALLAARPSLSAADICWEPKEVLNLALQQTPAGSGSASREHAAPTRH